MSEQWYDDNTLQWTDIPTSEWFLETDVTEKYEGLYQIWTDDDYVYAATTSGVYIIDAVEETQVAYVYKAGTFGDFPTVISDDDYVYMGTGSYGVKRLARTEISAGGNLFNKLEHYAGEPWITSNSTKYIHGNEDNLILCTVAGVDIIRKSSQSVINSTTLSGARKCFATSNEYYYTVSGTVDWSINRLNSSTADWATPDITYTTGSGFLQTASEIRDIFVTEGTSLAGNNNTLFVATDTNVVVYDEGTEEYKLFTTG